MRIMADKGTTDGTFIEDVGRLCLVLGALAALGLLGMWLFNPAGMGAELLLALAAALIGGVTGVVFAVPRSRRGQSDGQSLSGKDSGSSDYTANTNLEQMSDWLTKGLVGAGLVELNELPSYINRVAGSLAPAIGDTPSTRPVVVCVLGSVWRGASHLPTF